MDENLSSHLRQTYSEFAAPADTILTDPALRDQFADRVRMHPPFAGWATGDILRQLLRMRKAGELPRLRRRNARPPSHPKAPGAGGSRALARPGPTRRV